MKKLLLTVLLMFSLPLYAYVAYQHPCDTKQIRSQSCVKWGIYIEGKYEDKDVLSMITLVSGYYRFDILSIKFRSGRAKIETGERTWQKRPYVRQYTNGYEIELIKVKNTWTIEISRAWIT